MACAPRAPTPVSRGRGPGELRAAHARERTRDAHVRCRVSRRNHVHQPRHQVQDALVLGQRQPVGPLGRPGDGRVARPLRVWRAPLLALDAAALNRLVRARASATRAAAAPRRGRGRGRGRRHHRVGEANGALHARAARPPWRLPWRRPAYPFLDHATHAHYYCFAPVPRVSRSRAAQRGRRKVLGPGAAPPCSEPEEGVGAPTGSPVPAAQSTPRWHRRSSRRRPTPCWRFVPAAGAGALAPAPRPSRRAPPPTPTPTPPPTPPRLVGRGRGRGRAARRAPGEGLRAPRAAAAARGRRRPPRPRPRARRWRRRRSRARVRARARARPRRASSSGVGVRGLHVHEVVDKVNAGGLWRRGAALVGGAARGLGGDADRKRPGPPAAAFDIWPTGCGSAAARRRRAPPRFPRRAALSSPGPSSRPSSVG